MKINCIYIHAFCRGAGVILGTVLVGLLLTGARQGKPQSGILKDGVFTDTANSFRVAVSDDWKAKLESAESERRLTLIHKHPEPEHSKQFGSGMSSRNRIAFSKVQFHVVKSMGMAKTVIDSLTSADCSWQLRKTLWADLTPTFSGQWGFTRIAVQSKRQLNLAGRNATQWKGKICFAPGGSSAEIEMGLLWTAVDNSDYVLLVAASCESSILDWLSGETIKVLDSLEFTS